MTNQIASEISARVRSIERELIELRKDLYMHPEAPGQEKRTADIVYNELTRLGLRAERGVGGNGVIGLLKGRRDTPVVAWRADMDGWFTEDEIDKPYKSRVPGLKHACGHDVHTTIAIGVAKCLSSIRNQLQGSVKFIFQPDEERTEGARAMIAEGALENPKPNAVFGLHCDSTPVGCIVVNAGYMMPGKKDFEVHIEDTLLPSPDIDSILQRLTEVSELLCTNKDITPSSADEESNALIDHEKYARVVIKPPIIAQHTSEVLISGRVFAFAEDTFRYAQDRMTAAMRDMETLARRNIDPRFYVKEIPSIRNDSLLSEQSYAVLLPLEGTFPRYSENVAHLFAADDYSLFQNTIPGVFFFLGVSNRAKGIDGRLHTPTFDIDFDCLAIGTNGMSNILANYLNNQAGTR